MADAKKGIIPITIKKKFNRDTFPGRAKIDKVQHTAMEQGRKVERSVGDAMFAVSEAKRQLIQRIENYMNLNKLATTAKLPDMARPIKLIKDILDFIKKVKEFIDEIKELIEAIKGIIGYLQMIKARIQAFIQKCLNTIANFIADICNFNLPSLPAIPSLFGALHFDGFAFPKGAFDFNVKFDANFAFGKCKLRKPNLNIFRNYPTTKFGLGPSGTFGVVPALNPPLPNSFVQTNQTADELRNETKPVFRPDYNPQGAFKGSLPTPDQIVSNYSLPAPFFREHVLSLLGDAEGIIADMNPPGYTQQSTENAPEPEAGDLDRPLDLEAFREKLQPAIRAYCIKKVHLEAIVDSNWDWRVVWAWLLYMHLDREARKGVWIQAFQDAYETWVLPAYQDIADKPIPWHGDPLDDTAITQGPAEMLFTKSIKDLDVKRRGQILWMLSYAEASILGYTRSTRWDAFAAPQGTELDTKTLHYASGSTRDDLDFNQLPGGGNDNTLTLLLDSKGRANYPSILVIPEHLSPVVQQVVTWGFKDITGAGKFTATRASSRYVYTQLAETMEINFHSQFWREFRANWDDLLHEDPALQRIVYNYPQILNSAVNPLASRAEFERTKLDFLNRDASWAPGTPYLPTPWIPTLVTPPMGLQLQLGSPNGWGGVNPGHDPVTGEPLAGGAAGGNVDANGNPVPLVFNPEQFLAREDVKALPLNYQDTLLYLNQNYQNLLDIQGQVLGALDEQIAAAQTTMLESQVQIAQIEAMNYIIPDGSAGMPDAPSASGGTGSGTGTGTGSGTGTGTGSGTGSGTGTTPGDATTPPAEDANVFISPENAITDIVAMGTNGTFALVEKARLVANMDRLDTERLAVRGSAVALLVTRPDLANLLTNADNTWDNLNDWLNALTPNYKSTTEATPLPAGGVGVLKDKLVAYYSAFTLLDLATKTASGGGGTTAPRTFVQPSPAMVWVVNHGLGYYPDPTVYNTQGVEMWAEIRNTSVNTFEVRHGAPMAGSVSYR